MRMTCIGVVIGLGGAFAASSVLESLLVGVTRLDVSTYGAVIGLLVLVAAVASVVPALRATRVDPAITLRGD